MNTKGFFKCKVLPILVVILLFGLTSISGVPFIFLSIRLSGKEAIQSFPWISVYFQKFMQMVVALLIILFLGGGIRSYGLTLRSSNFLILPAILVGALFGIIMTLVDHLPTILSVIQ